MRPPWPHHTKKAQHPHRPWPTPPHRRLGVPPRERGRFLDRGTVVCRRRPVRPQPRRTSPPHPAGSADQSSAAGMSLLVNPLPTRRTLTGQRSGTASGCSSGSTESESASPWRLQRAGTKAWCSPVRMPGSGGRSTTTSERRRAVRGLLLGGVADVPGRALPRTSARRSEVADGIARHVRCRRWLAHALVTGQQVALEGDIRPAVIPSPVKPAPTGNAPGCGKHSRRAVRATPWW
jgi:hypothetical protein